MIEDRVLKSMTFGIECQRQYAERGFSEFPHQSVIRKMAEWLTANPDGTWKDYCIHVVEELDKERDERQEDHD